MAENKGKIGNGDPAGRLVRTISPAIYPRNQGYLDNGDCPESPGLMLPAAGGSASRG